MSGWDSILGGLVVAGLGILVQYWLDRALHHGFEPSPVIFHHYGFQALGVGVTFAIVFPTQLAWNRYWEARICREHCVVQSCEQIDELQQIATHFIIIFPLMPLMVLCLTI